MVHSEQVKAVVGHSCEVTQNISSLMQFSLGQAFTVLRTYLLSSTCAALVIEMFC